MNFQQIIRIEEHPPRADKSAVRTINRRLRVTGGAINHNAHRGPIMYFQKVKWIIEEALAAHRPISLS